MTQLKRLKRQNEELKDLVVLLYESLDDVLDSNLQLLETAVAPKEPKLAEEFRIAKHNSQRVRRGARSTNSEREVVALHRFEGFCDGEG